MKLIAFFDFDGTITTKDTMLEFIKFCKGHTAFYAGILINLPVLIAYKTGLISNQAAKEKILTYFFNGYSIVTFEKECREFSNLILPGLIRPGALSEIQRLRNDSAELVIVTSSIENWVKPWADLAGASLIGTRLELVAGRLTGKIMAVNCHGKEKVTRIKQKYSLADYEKIIAYGDTPGDRPMLSIAHESYYRPFRDKK